jgi:hypothetical protein
MSLRNGLIGISYFSIAIILFNPRLYFSNLKQKLFFYSLLLSIPLSIFFNLEFMPVYSFFSKFPRQQFLLFIIFSIILYQQLIIFISIWIKFIYQSYRINDIKKATILLFSFFMSIATFKITHQFSSRYVAQYALFLFLPEKEEKKETSYFLKIILLIFGSIIGYYSLNSYYSQ